MKLAKSVESFDQKVGLGCLRIKRELFLQECKLGRPSQVNGHFFDEERTTIYPNFLNVAILSSVAGCVDKKPPPPPSSELRISHVSVSIITSLA